MARTTNVKVHVPRFKLGVEWVDWEKQEAISEAFSQFVSKDLKASSKPVSFNFCFK